MALRSANLSGLLSLISYWKVKLRHHEEPMQNRTQSARMETKTLTRFVPDVNGTVAGADNRLTIIIVCEFALLLAT